MDGQSCQQPGCTGFIESGFCNICGLEPTPGVNGNSASILPPPTARYSTTRFGTVSTAVTGTRPGTAGSSFTTGRTGSGSSRRGTRGSRSGSSRRQLGLGLIQVPELPALDPATVIMTDPAVPENKRFCSNCNDRLKREKGFCPKCGRPYNLVPTLKPGDILAEQYEVVGCLAFGGLGWIYLAKDTVLSRWVVLKGLLNAQDETAAAAAVAERQFLAAVKHANIVGVYNFVQRGTEGFIVMEYVGGKSLKAIRKERGPLPVAEAIAYVHRILSAFAYLHRQEPPLVYCDFKPDNFMLEGDDVKLIDMGGVRRVDDPNGDIYGTKGYSAPEAGDGPTIVSDLYTVARTLAVLICDFRGYQSTYEFTLPPAEEQPVLGQYESLHRFLLKGTQADPDQRFQTADEMAEQLAGILREMVSTEQNVAHPSESTLFGGDAMRLRTSDDEAGSKPGPALIPGLKVDIEDKAAQFILANAGGSQAPEQQVLLYEHAVRQYPKSIEARLRLAKSLIDCGRTEPAESLLASVQTDDPWDWRVIWLRGISHFREGRSREAAAHFDHVYSELPGELAPKLALALAAEATGEIDYAAKLYNIVSVTDPNFTTASFGLARCLSTRSRRDEAIAAYRRVPASSSAYTNAQIALARTWLLSNATVAPGHSELQNAASAIEALTLDGLERHRLAAEVQQIALGLLESRCITPNPKVQVFGKALQETSLREGIESALRGMAHLVSNYDEKVHLVDLANQIRPTTLV